VIRRRRLKDFSGKNLVICFRLLLPPTESLSRVHCARFRSLRNREADGQKDNVAQKSEARCSSDCLTAGHFSLQPARTLFPRRSESPATADRSPGEERWHRSVLRTKPVLDAHSGKVRRILATPATPRARSSRTRILEGPRKSAPDAASPASESQKS